MICLVVCTEGDSSEPAAIREFSILTAGQTYPEPDVFTVPLGGNQGHKKLFENAGRKVAELKDPRSDSVLSLASDADTVEKWVICDYDVMDKNGISEEEFRKSAREAGYEVVINKPNFEFFVLTLLAGSEYATSIKPKDYITEIDKAVKRLNDKNIKEKGFSDTMTIPPYSKNKHVAEKFFGNMFSYNPDLIKNFHDTIGSNEKYTEMARILQRITEVIDLNSR